MIALTFSTGEAVLVNHSAGPLLFCLTKKRTVHYFVTMNYSTQQSPCEGERERGEKGIFCFFVLTSLYCKCKKCTEIQCSVHDIIYLISPWFIQVEHLRTSSHLQRRPGQDKAKHVSLSHTQPLLTSLGQIGAETQWQSCQATRPPGASFPSDDLVI